MKNSYMKSVEFMKAQFKEIKNSADSGLSIPEVLIAIGLSGLLALGCAQLALASFASASYTQNVAVKSLSTGNINRLITTDMEKATGFLDSSGQFSTRNSTECSTDTATDAGTRPLLTLFHADGTSHGYEVRTTDGVGTLWRVSCPTVGVANGSAQILQTHLPAASATSWDTAIMCVNFPAGGNITVFTCDKDVTLNSMVSNPGIVFTVPASTTVSSTSQSEQKIVAARNVG
jgi:Tfp pilus assembly protein PilW